MTTNPHHWGFFVVAVDQMTEGGDSTKENTMCNGPCGTCTCPAARRQRLFDGQDVTPEDIRLFINRPWPTKGVEIVEVESPEVSPPPNYNRGIYWRPGR